MRCWRRWGRCSGLGDDPLRGLSSLVGLLTVIPARGSLEDAARWFYLVPIVGFIRGAITSLSLVAAAWTPPYVVAALAVVLHYVGQGFMHADGFSDFSEALLASRSGLDPGTILKDTHRGSFAIASFSAFALLLFASSLYAVSSHFYMSFMAAEIGQVSAMAAALHFGGPEPYDGMAKALKARMNAWVLAAVCAFSAALVFLIGGGPFAIAIPLASLAIGYVSALTADRAVGFTNGDALGFAGEISFLASLLMIAHV
jgi:adenosylcobinamide-GDP ribazoletransferase